MRGQEDEKMIREKARKKMEDTEKALFDAIVGLEGVVEEEEIEEYFLKRGYDDTVPKAIRFIGSLFYEPWY